jgi:hypothetical protein
MATRVYKTEAEAAADFGAVMAELREGHRVRVGELELFAGESDAATAPPIRTAEEVVCRARAFEAKLGYAPGVDESFAADLREIVGERERLSARSWE